MTVAGLSACASPTPIRSPPSKAIGATLLPRKGRRYSFFRAACRLLKRGPGAPPYYQLPLPLAGTVSGLPSLFATTSRLLHDSAQSDQKRSSASQSCFQEPYGQVAVPGSSTTPSSTRNRWYLQSVPLMIGAFAGHSASSPDTRPASTIPVLVHRLASFASVRASFQAPPLHGEVFISPLRFAHFTTSITFVKRTCTPILRSCFGTTKAKVSR